MGHKPKTRCYARIDGVKRLLFEVRELTDKSLNLTSNFGLYFSDEESERLEVEEQHYSVHKTNNGVDTCITQKTSFKDGQPRSVAAYIHNTSDYLLWPIYAHRVPIFYRKSFYSRPKDHSFCVARFGTQRAVFYYTVFVAKSGFNPRTIDIGEANIFMVPFTELSLIIFTSYQNVPSINDGDVSGLSTSSKVIGNIRSEDHRQLYVESIPSDMIAECNWFLMFKLRDRLRERLADLVDEKGDLELTTALTSFFVKAPLKK